MTDEEARQLCAEIASGNSEAFARLYRLRHERLLRAICRATRRDEAFAYDVLHDAMLKVTRSMPKLSGTSALDAWLHRTALTTALDHLRRERRRSAREGSHARQRAEKLAAVRQCEGDDDVERLEALLASLNADERHLLSLRFGLEWTLSRIAAALGLGPGAVDGRLRRLTNRVRSRTGAETEDRTNA